MLSIKKLAAKRRAKAIKRQNAHMGKIQMRKLNLLKMKALQEIFKNPALRQKFIAHQKELEVSNNISSQVIKIVEPDGSVPDDVKEYHENKNNNNTP